MVKELKKNPDILKYDLKFQCQQFNSLISKGAIMLDEEGNLIINTYGDVIGVINNIHNIKQEIKELENEQNNISIR